MGNALPSDFPILKQHPLSAAWPPMSDTDFDNLKASIASVGQKNPITRRDEEVLDGWHRYKACLALGRMPILEDYDGNDPAGFVIAMNNDRRHVSAMDRAKAVVKCREWAQSGVAESRRQKPEPPARVSRDGDENLPAETPRATRAQMAREAGVSEDTIKRAKRQVAAERGDTPLPAPKPRQTAPPRGLGPTAVKKLKTRIGELEGQVSAARAEADAEKRRRGLLEDWRNTEAKDPESLAAAYAQLNATIAEKQEAVAETAAVKAELHDCRERGKELQRENRRLSMQLEQAQRASQ